MANQATGSRKCPVGHKNAQQELKMRVVLCPLGHSDDVPDSGESI